MGGKLVCTCLLFTALLSATDVLVAQDTQETAKAVTQAQEAASQAKASARSAENSMVVAVLIWVVSPFLVGMPLIFWWPIFLILVIWDGYSMTRNSWKILEYDSDASEYYGALILNLLIMFFGLSWLGIIDPVYLITRDRQMLLYLVLGHCGIGLLVGLTVGLWDLYFIYYLGTKAKLKERAAVVKEQVLARLRKQHEASAAGSATVFDESADSVKQDIRKSREEDPERKQLMKKLKVSRYVPRYVYIAVVWELYLAWRLCFQFLVRWAELFRNFGQMIADYYHGKLATVGLDD